MKVRARIDPIFQVGVRLASAPIHRICTDLRVVLVIIVADHGILVHAEVPVSLCCAISIHHLTINMDLAVAVIQMTCITRNSTHNFRVVPIQINRMISVGHHPVVNIYHNRWEWAIRIRREDPHIKTAPRFGVHTSRVWFDCPEQMGRA